MRPRTYLDCSYAKKECGESVSDKKGPKEQAFFTSGHEENAEENMREGMFLYLYLQLNEGSVPLGERPTRLGNPVQS